MQRPISSIRSVLVGFAGLLILMGCLAVDSARRTREVSKTSAALRKESRERDELMDRLQNDTYRSATLARDLAGLVAAGYRVARMALVDLFPQTFHLETVVRVTI